MKVLIVDDESGIRDVIKEYCLFEDYNVLEAEDGQSALDIIKNNSDIVGVNWFSVNFNKLYKKENQFEIFVNHIE